NFNKKESLVFEEFSETEIKNGIRQICEGAMYCHDNQISHSNINPSSIFISPSRDWKLAGFEFSRSIESGRAAVGWDYETFSTVTSPLMPPINFAAPEIVQHKEIRSKSDAFSIGILAICLYNFENFSEFKDEISSFSDYAAFLDLLENNSYFDGKIDFQKNKKSILINLLKVDSEKRFSIQDFLDSDFFLEKELIVLRDCEHFSTFNETRKTNLLENVSQNLSLFNEKIIVLKIVPVLTSFYNLF
ncbi:Protein kinase domain-containing protein ppk32, variant 2, partial [Bonamia ostreae]